MSAREKVVKNIIKYRKLRNMTQKDLAIRLCKKLKFVENLEAGKYSKAITFKLLCELSDILCVKMTDLLEDIDINDEI